MNLVILLIYMKNLNKELRKLQTWCENLQLASSPFQVGEKFRSRALKFPGLISGCTINWFQSWPEDALIDVADYFLSNFDLLRSFGARDQLVELMGNIHNTVANYCKDYFERYCICFM